MANSVNQIIDELLKHARRQSPLTRIASRVPSLRGKTRSIAQFLLQDTARIADMSIEEIAAECNTSRATILRASNELGYRNFTQLRASLLGMADDTTNDADGAVGKATGGEGTESPATAMIDNVCFACTAGTGTHTAAASANNSTTALERQLASDPAYETMSQCLTLMMDTFSTLDYEQIEQAAQLMVSHAPVAIYGGALSGGIARVIYNRLRYIGLAAYASSDVEAISNELRHGCGSLFCISHKAGTPNIFRVLNDARRNHVPSILLTNLKDAPACTEADLVLATNLTSFPTDGYDILARIAELYLFELLNRAIARLLQ